MARSFLALFFILIGFLACKGRLGSEAHANPSDPNFVPKYGPKAKPHATLLRSQNDYVRKNAALDFWGLMPYYVGMQGGHTASAASMVMALNTLKKDSVYSSSDELVTEATLLEKVKTENWSSQITGKEPKGVNLKQLEAIAKNATSTFGVKANVELNQFENSEADLNKLRQILAANERSADDVIIANYIQMAFTGDPEGAVGTYSVVGAFDQGKDRVLVLETDRKYYEPYWVSTADFLDGVSGLREKGTNKNLGGLLTIRKVK